MNDRNIVENIKSYGLKSIIISGFGSDNNIPKF